MDGKRIHQAYIVSGVFLLRLAIAFSLSFPLYFLLSLLVFDKSVAVSSVFLTPLVILYLYLLLSFVRLDWVGLDWIELDSDPGFFKVVECDYDELRRYAEEFICRLVSSFIQSQSFLPLIEFRSLFM